MIAPSKDASPWQGRITLSHGILALILVLWRPLIATPNHLGLDHQIWHLLLLLGWGLLTWEWVAGWRRCLRAHWGGLLAAMVVILLLPAWLRAANPAGGAGFAIAVLGQLLFAGYLIQIVDRWRHLIFAALIASLALLSILGLAQRYWVLPAMEGLLQQGELDLDSLGGSAEEIGERIRRGGVYASFTLANTLALVMASMLLLCIGSGLRSLRERAWPASALLIPIALAGISVLSIANAKGAWLGLSVGMLAVLLYRLGPRARWAALGLGLGAALAIFTRLPWMEVSSVAVRLGYWQSALGLWWQQPLWGHGWEQFAHQHAAVMPVWGEWSKRVHNEILEALVAGGLWAGLALAACLGYLAYPRNGAAAQDRSQKVDNGPDHGTAASDPAWIPLLAAPLLAYAGLLGTGISDNIAFWPGGQQAGIQILWMLLLGGAATAIIAFLADGRFIPGHKWLWATILVLSSACLIDFHLHETGFLAILVVLSVLNSGSWRGWTWESGQPRQRLVSALAILALLLGLGLYFQASQRRAALEWGRSLDHLLDQARAGDAWAQGWLQQQSPASGIHGPDYLQFAQREMTRLALAFPASEPLHLRAQLQLTSPRQRIDGIREHQRRFQPSSATWAAIALAHAELREWTSAIAAQRQVIQHAPWHLPHRQRLIRFYEQAKMVSGSDAAMLERLIDDEQNFIERYNPEVFSRNRAR
ncbi:MAG: O-antigen ligase domain-containing protein [Planctomycetota bacterium]|nr:MAG: O-antigen ligase domain-containing protein [Planctomycetota bacterium]